MVLYLRNSLNKAVESRLGGDEAEVFSKFDKDMLKGKFIVGAVENNLFGGKNFTIVFQDRPHTEFVVWIYNGASGLEVRSFEVSEDELSELRKRRIHYKQFIQDRIHAL